MNGDYVNGEKTPIKTYRDLHVWQDGVVFVTELYRLTRDFPREEMFGVVSQIRRAAISIPSNIAEGYGRRSSRDYVRFLQISMGSLFEIQTQLEIARNLEYLSSDTYESLYAMSRKIERMLSSLIRKIQERKE
ncbi:MAG TPA: four helix bundle protein [Kiritimatiellia bacterium]|nr:four helix bundle protein [Kiritimatiellia bacterium]HNS81956.1 four helix bundle protein [Kiritimatiellia bacterium]